MNFQPLVSICVPNYNGGKYIYESITSILNQTYKNIEVLFLDNCSTDNSITVISKFKDKRLKIYKNKKNQGYSKNINKGINLSKGKYSAIYHSDDIYDKRIVEEQVAVLEKSKSIGGVFTLSNIINNQGKFIRKNSLPFKCKKKVLVGSKDLFFPLMLKYGNFFVCPTSMVRKSVYKKVGLYTLERLMIEDQEMWLRILNYDHLAIINKSLINYRFHQKQGSMGYNKLREEISPEYVIYDEYINKKFVNLNKDTLKKYRQMKSKGFLFCAVGSLLNKNYKKVEVNLKYSKLNYSFNYLTLFGFMQVLMSLKINFILRPLIKNCFKIMKSLNLQKKINFLNYV